jgi:SAM-dependent methyltransferase
MAQKLIRDFLEDLAMAVEMPDPVVEFGSMQVEEAQDGDLRPVFAGREFTGCDMREGPGVDRVEDLRALTYEDASVGTAICVDTLEHCEDPPAACRELHRVTAEGGVCVISSVMLFGIHGYPNDYFRFTPEAFRSMLGGFDDVWVAGIGDPDIPMQVVGVGVKGRSLDLSLERLPRLAAAQRDWDEARGRVRLGPFRVPPGEMVRLLVGQTPRIVRDRLSRARAARR